MKEAEIIIISIIYYSRENYEEEEIYWRWEANIIIDGIIDIQYEGLCEVWYNDSEKWRPDYEWRRRKTVCNETDEGNDWGGNY